MDLPPSSEYYALAAYYRFVNGQTSLYDMSDVAIQKTEPVTLGDPGTTDPTEPTTPGTTEPANPGADTPTTGDAGTAVWLSALGASALCAAALIGQKKRRA